ncbi:hypothetical protein [Pedobacter psychroterrae]|uniref:MG2 domain-containing protein n=1 Tax=Pedobacter psychroterrae TaxID=2530453 RepID=A0A4R0NCH1_9SPHI|nr:hypothetical protein [Pedobacter psychroterrae]TCC98020.1 hypothetical protein EZ437_19425 [Pedobacter psychroterrae]
MRSVLLSLLWYLLISFASVTALKAQRLTQSAITEKMQYYNLANPSASLFVHFDKTIYTNNETVWFTGYLIKDNSNNLSKHQVLSVALVRDIDSAIIKQGKYVMSNTLSFGSMILPDSMLTGNYHFQVSTNRVSSGIPDAVFTQPIVIKTNIEPAFSASIKLLKAGNHGKTPNEVLISATTRDFRFLPKPIDVSYRYGNLFKTEKTSKSGELVLMLPEQEGISDPNVYAKLKYGKDSSFINLTLPVTRRNAIVRFYPEGGNLIDNLPGRVAWEVKDQQLNMVSAKALLFKDKKLLDTIETNSYGIGKFMLTPEINSIYQIKLLHSGFTDTTYRLPPAIAEGVNLYFADAAVKDTLKVRIINKTAQKVYVRIHDFNETFFISEMTLSAAHKIFKVPLSEIPKGLKTITVSDSIGRPLSERMFFARYDPQQKIIITTDKSIYNQREKVVLKVKLIEPDTIGFLSIACVQNNRFPGKLSNDIESYINLRQQLTTLPMAPAGNGFSDKDFVENMLLVRGWSRYTWQNILKAESTDTIKTYDPLALKIKVAQYNKPLKVPIDLGIMIGTTVGVIKTDSAGQTVFKNEELVIPADTKIQVIALGKNQDLYSVKVDDPYRQLNKTYLKLIHADRTSVPSTVQNNNELSLKPNEKINRLSEVKITAGSNVHYKRGVNACGDYVCSYNVLNCRNHISDYGNRHPVAGRTYRNGSEGGTIVYRDCKSEDRDLFIVPLPGIYTKKEFYIDDYTEPLEPAFVSTLYWNHGDLFDPAEKEFIFYTGDITGKFRIVVQGMVNDDVAYHEHFIEVQSNPKP